MSRFTEALSLYVVIARLASIWSSAANSAVGECVTNRNGNGAVSGGQLLAFSSTSVTPKPKISCQIEKELNAVLFGLI
jgi:hypothetical protein